jgi:hypothetical protein
VAAVEGGDDVRLSEDYFIEAQKYEPPEVKITRPGRDFKATPIEEVTIAVEAKDGFALKSVDLHYSVNGAPEKVIPLLQNKDGKTATGNATLAMEDYKVQPGDVVSVYATAKDARKTSTTDMFFIEMQPFERNYTRFRSGKRKSSPPPGIRPRAGAPAVPSPRTRRFSRRCRASCATRPSRCPTV